MTYTMMHLDDEDKSCWAAEMLASHGEDPEGYSTRELVEEHDINCLICKGA